MQKSSFESCSALLFGHYHPLLLTRDLLLGTIRCNSTIAMTMVEFQREAVSSVFHLVVLCQSCSTAERAEITHFMAKCNLQARVLMVSSPVPWQDPGNNVTVLASMARPAQFLQAASSVLAQAVPTPIARHPFFAAPR